MTDIQGMLAQICEGKDCLVVGAGPSSPLWPPPDDVAIVVNGGISTVPGPVEMWVLNARTAEDAKNHRLYPTMVAQGKGRHVELLVLLSKDEDNASAQTLRRLKAQGTTWGAHVSIINSDRRRIEHLAGARLENEIRGNTAGGPMTTHAISAGVAAVCFAFWAGAESVRMAGFSWEPGYAYQTPFPVKARGHVAGDKLGLARLQTQYGDRLRHNLSLSQEHNMARLDPHTRRMNRRTRLNQVVPPYAGPLPRRVIATRDMVFYAELGADNEKRFREGEVITLRDPKHFKPSHMRDVWTPPEASQPPLSTPTERGEALADQISGRGQARRRVRGPARLKKNAADLEPDGELVGATPQDVL